MKVKRSMVLAEIAGLVGRFYFSKLQSRYKPLEFISGGRTLRRVHPNHVHDFGRNNNLFRCRNCGELG